MAGMLGKKEVAELAAYLEQQEGVRIRRLGGPTKGTAGGGWFAQFPDGSATGIHLSTSDSNGHHNIRRIMKQNGIEWPFEKGAARAQKETVMTMTENGPGIVTEGYPKYLLNRNPGSGVSQRVKEEALRLLGQGKPVTQATISAETGYDPASVNQALYQQGFRWMQEKVMGGAEGRRLLVRQWAYVEGAETPFRYKRRPPKSDDGRMEAYDAQQAGEQPKQPDLAEQGAALLTTMEEQHLTPIQRALLDAVRTRADTSEPERDAADRLITTAAIPPEQKAALRAEVDTLLAAAPAEPTVVAETVTEPEPEPEPEPTPEPPAITEADLDAATALATEAEERARAAEARAAAMKADHDRLLAERKAAVLKFEQSEARNLTLQRNLEDAGKRHRQVEETLRRELTAAHEAMASTAVAATGEPAADDSWVVTPEPEQALQALIDQAGGLGLEVEVRVRRKR